jgi:cyclopropane fatty-acyl-phospholipid synthase-like methyltransferase
MANFESLTTRLNAIAATLLQVWHRFVFDLIFSFMSDPWQYTSKYEQAKFDHILELLPAQSAQRVLELGCAEGHFSVRLAPHVDRLICADFSQIALSRAAKRCVDHPNIEFVHLDIVKDVLPGQFDLIVCDEVLYYIGGFNLQQVCNKLTKALVPGGYLITTNANRVKTESTQAKWLQPYGAQLIGQMLADTAPLRLIQETHTAFFRTHLFQSCDSIEIASLDDSTVLIDLTNKVFPAPPEMSLVDIFSLSVISVQVRRLYQKFHR